MKVCHFTSGHNSLDGRIFHKQCKSLAEAGYEVYLVAQDGMDLDRDGVHVRSVRMNSANRFYRMLKTAKDVYKKALEIDADIYHFHDPELIPYGKRLKRLGKKVIFDSHEDNPANISEKHWIPKPFRKLVAYWYEIYERKSISSFDALIAVTPHVVDRLRKCNKNTFMVTNYPIVNPEDEVRPFNVDGPFCYVGRISDEGLQKNFIKALGMVEGARYLLAGPCSPKYLSELEKIQGWEKVDFVGEVAFSDSRDIFSRSLAGVQLMDYIANCGYKIGTLGNTKLFGYLEAGLPVICTDYELWKEIVDVHDCGICINPHDITALADAIRFFATHPLEAKRMGENGRRAILEKYNWKMQEKVLLECYSSIHA